MKSKIKICLCPATINWIRKHLLKSARKQFTSMITQTGVKSIKKITKRKRKFSPAQLRAQRLFAKRSRAGTLRRRR